MLVIEAPDFDVGHQLRILALQGDWGLAEAAGANGGRYVIDAFDRAHQCCNTLLGHLTVGNAHVVAAPELSIPKKTVAKIIDVVKDLPRSLVFLGGIEGLTRDEYDSLLGGEGKTHELDADAVGDYVNSMLMLVKTPTKFVAEIRAKRVPSRAENTGGPPMTKGKGPFVAIRLGPAALTLVPVICSEFVWTQPFWDRLEDEVDGVIDYMPVLQHNSDPTSRYTSPELHRAHTQSAKTKDTRFIFVNQGLGSYCDGTCYVVVPPTAPANPAFDYGFNELWHLPGAGAHRGFRVPDTTGCIWSATISSRHTPPTALGTRVCEGNVVAVLAPLGTRLSGLPAGLMRSTAAAHKKQSAGATTPEIKANIDMSLDASNARYVLRGLTTEIANDVFYRMVCADMPRWDSVEATVGELVESAILLATGGHDVVLTSVDGGNCSAAGRTVSILYAPNVDASLIAKFGTSRMLDAGGIPLGVVLTGVNIGSAFFGATKIGQVTRSDRVTSTSSDLSGVPTKVDNSSVTIRIDDVEFCSVQDLRPNLKVSGTVVAQGRLKKLFPSVFGL